ncbi:hypothetical protein [Actinocorallia aurea]
MALRVTISHFWYPDHTPATTADPLHYLVLEVEPVPEALRHVTVRRTLNDKETFAEGLSIPLRHGDCTVYLPSEDAYQLINEGLHARNTPAAITVPPTGGLAQEAAQCLDELERLQDWEDTPLLLWQSIPPRSAQILPGLHSNDGVRGALRDQDVLRADGFDFQDTYGRLRVHEGGSIWG